MRKDGVCSLDFGTSQVEASVIDDSGSFCLFQEGDQDVCRQGILLTRQFRAVPGG